MKKVIEVDGTRTSVYFLPSRQPRTWPDKPDAMFNKKKRIGSVSEGMPTCFRTSDPIWSTSGLNAKGSRNEMLKFVEGTKHVLQRDKLIADFHTFNNSARFREDRAAPVPLKMDLLFIKTAEAHYLSYVLQTWIIFFL